MVATQIQVILISAKDIKNTKLFKRMTPCALVTIPGTTAKKISRSASEGGSCPIWNETMLLTVDENSIGKQSILNIELFSSSSISDTSLGVVKVPLSDILIKRNEQASRSYEVILNGKPFGSINLTVCIGSPGIFLSPSETISNETIGPKNTETSPPNPQVYQNPPKRRTLY